MSTATISPISKKERQPSKSASVRARLDYPVIDTDLHTVEFTPLLEDYIDQIGVQKASISFAPRSSKALPISVMTGTHNHEKSAAPIAQCGRRGGSSPPKTRMTSRRCRYRSSFRSG